MEITNQISGNQFLTFSLRDEHFAMEIYKVREVLDVTILTRIPRMPDYMCGVINLRGNVVPVIDLGLKLGMEPVEKTVNTCIMIVDILVDGETDTVQIGVLTDSVQEVVSLTQEEIEPVPKMGTNLDTEFIKGMGRQQEKFLILLNINRVLSAEGQAVLRDFEHEMSPPPEITEPAELHA